MRILTDLLARLRSLAFRRREDRELDDELRFHLEMEASYRAQHGATPADARRASAIALGGVERVKDDVRDARGTRLVADAASDAAFAIRSLARSPGFAAVAVLTLAIGIGGTTAVFSAVNAVMLQPLPYQQPGQLVRLYQSSINNPADKGFVTPVHFLAFRRDLSSFSAVAGMITYNETGADVGLGDQVRRIRLLPISSDYFDVVRVQPRLGRALQPQDNEGDVATVVLGHDLWEEQFHGDPAAIGRTLTMNGRAYTVAGVMPAGFTDPIAGNVDAWVGFNVVPGRDASNADNHYVTVIGRLRPGVTIEQGQAEVGTVALALARQYPDARDSRARIYPLKDDVLGSSSRILELLLGAVALVLLLVCVNIASLLLVRGSERAREFTVRAALGAERARLVRQMLAESFVLAIAGDAAGLVVARAGMAVIVHLGAGVIPRLATLHLDTTLLGFSLAVATVCAVGFGLAPALGVSRADAGGALRGEARASTAGAGQIRARELLVAAQVALAFVLLVGAGLLLSSLDQIHSVPLGIRPNGVLTFELNLPAARYDSTSRARFYEQVARSLEVLPDVRAAGGVSKLPSTGPFHQWGTRAVTGPLAHTTRGFIGAQQRIVSGDYFDAVGIPLLRGRLFDDHDDRSVSLRVVVSKSVADKVFPGVDAVGQTVNTAGQNNVIIGVVGDVALNGEGTAAPYIYHAHRQYAGNRNWALTQVVATTSSPEAIVPEVRRTIGRLDPALVVYKAMSLDDAIGAGAAERVLTLRILGAFAGVAIALAAVGLFGALSYGVRLRTRELGIRMALGAPRGAIRAGVLRGGLAVTAAGLGAGFIGAAALSRLMASFLFRVAPLDARVYVAAAVAMTLVGAAAAYLPAHRATTVNPRTALQ